MFQMASLPQPLGLNTPFAANTASSAGGAPSAQATKDRKMASAEQLVLELSNPDTRENALLDLSKVFFFTAHLGVFIDFGNKGFVWSVFLL